MIDPEEFETAEKRADFMEKGEIDIVNKSKIQKAGIDEEFGRFSRDIEQLKHKTLDLKEELAHLNKAFLVAVKMLRKTASKSDLEVVEKKINAWSPDKLVTKKELKKLLKG